MPQALNRFAATPLGQPGVYEAVASSWNPFTDDYVSNIGKGVFSTAVSEVAVRGIYKYFKASAYTIIGDSISTTVNRAVTRNAFADNAILRAGALGFLVRDFTPTPLRGLGRSLFDKAVMLNRTMVTEEAIIGYSFSYGHRLPLGRAAGKLFASKLGLQVIDAGIGFGIDVAYQAWLDFDNPYLTNKQKLQRALIGQGSGSIVSFIGGGLVGAAFGGPVGFVVGVGISIGWDMFIAPTIYKFIGAVPIRDLASLSVNQ